MNEQDIIGINELLATPKRIVIIPHRSPDGDAMGSTLALYHLLLKTGQDPVVVAPNEFPDFLSWLPGSENVLIYEKDKDAVGERMLHAEIIFTLDFNALHRTGEMEHVLAKSDATFVMIDHHQSPDSYAKYMYSNTAYGSTCEMIYNFITQLGHHEKIDTTIATCIYTGIVTDSGSFRFPSTTSNTHRVVADLIDKGINNGQIHNQLFDNSSYNSLLLLGRALQNMKILTNHKTCYITLTQQELDDHGYVKGDTEGIVNYALRIKGIIFAAIFIENAEDNMIKISFRSQGNFDVNAFAREHFNGGGHVNAAGGRSALPLSETISKFENILSTINI